MFHLLLDTPPKYSCGASGLPAALGALPLEGWVCDCFTKTWSELVVQGDRCAACPPAAATRGAAGESIVLPWDKPGDDRPRCSVRFVRKTGAGYQGRTTHQGKIKYVVLTGVFEVAGRPVLVSRSVTQTPSTGVRIWTAPSNREIRQAVWRGLADCRPFVQYWTGKLPELTEPRQ